MTTKNIIKNILDNCVDEKTTQAFSLKESVFESGFWLRVFAVVAFMPLFLLPLSAATDNDWQETLKASRGKTVYFNAWGGSQQVNAYLNWARGRLQKIYNVTLVHVKVSDTAEVVARIRAEIKAKPDQLEEGSVDLVWLNGENFRKLKQESLLYGPFTDRLPNMKFVADEEILREVDFSEPIEGYESPWGRALLTFFYDSSLISQPTANIKGLLAASSRYKGRFTYPAPPNFYGTTFLKQIAYETLADPSVLKTAVDPKKFTQQTAALWAYLDRLHPTLWRKGKAFPVSLAKMQDMLDTSELLISFSFNPLEAEQRKRNGTFPQTVKAYGHETGTIGNAHFVAIPKNAANKSAALIVANFLLSPQAQGRKNNVSYWGDPSVLDLKKMDAKNKKVFISAAGDLADMPASKQLREPHVSWVESLEAEWKRRYAR